MPKALFLSLPLHGHTNPSLPLVAELVRRGEDVIYYSTDSFAPRVEQTGARYRRYRNAFLADMRSLPERLEQLNWLLMRTTAEVLDEELEAIREQRPDYVITDSVAPWGQWIGEILGVPVVTSVSTFAFNRHVLAFGLSRGVRPKSARLFLSKMRHIAKALLLSRRLRVRYHARGPGMMGTVSGSSPLNIVYTSRSFQPCEESFDARYVFVGPSIAPRSHEDGFPWDRVRHPVVIYVSMGTLFNTDASVYRECFEAFRNLDCQVILSTGTSLSADDLGPPPANFVVRPRVPQLEVLERAAAFVTHGGMNSVSESLYYGVPMLAIPQMGEQEIVARRVEGMGAGLYVAKSEVTAEGIRRSVQSLLAKESFRRQAAVIGESFRAAGGVALAADAIQDFVQRRASIH